MPANPSRSAHHLALYRYSFIAAERPGVAIVGRASWSANLITRFLRKLLGAASDKNALPLRFLKSVGRLGFLFLLAGFICADGHWNPRKRAYILRQCACHGPLIRVLHGACLFYELRPSPIRSVRRTGDNADSAARRLRPVAATSSAKDACRTSSRSPIHRSSPSSRPSSAGSDGGRRARSEATTGLGTTGPSSTSRPRSSSRMATSSRSASPTAAR